MGGGGGEIAKCAEVMVSGKENVTRILMIIMELVQRQLLASLIIGNVIKKTQRTIYCILKLQQLN